MISTLVTAGFGAIWGAVLRYGITNYGKKHWSSNFPYRHLFMLWLELGYWEVIRPFLH